MEILKRGGCFLVAYEFAELGVFFEAYGCYGTTLLNLCAIPGGFLLPTADFYFLSSTGGPLIVLMLITPSSSGVGDSDMTGIVMGSFDATGDIFADIWALQGRVFAEI